MIFGCPINLVCTIDAKCFICYWNENIRNLGVCKRGNNNNGIMKHICLLDSRIKSESMAYTKFIGLWLNNMEQKLQYEAEKN